MKHLTILFVLFLTCSHALAVDIVNYGACNPADGDASEEIELAIADSLVMDHEVVFSCLAPIQQSVFVDMTNELPITLSATNGGGIVVDENADPELFDNPLYVGGTAAVILDDCSGCIIDGLTFDGNDVSVVLLVVSNSDSVEVTSNTFRNVGGGDAKAAVWGIDNVDNTYGSNTIHDTGNEVRGLRLGNGGHADDQAYVHNNVVTNTGHTGIVIESSNATVDANTVTGAGGSGIIVSSSLGYPASNVDILNNVVIGNNFHGIQSDSVDGTRSVDILVKNNVSAENTNTGVYVVNADGWIVEDNVIKNNGSISNFGRGVLIQAASGITIRNNVIKETRSEDPGGFGEPGTPTQDNGIEILGKNEVVVKINGEPGTVPGTVFDVTIQDNECQNNLFDGITVNTSPNSDPGIVDGVLIEGNTITHDLNPGRDDIRLWEQGECSVINVTDGGNNGAIVNDLRDCPDCPPIHGCGSGCVASKQQCTLTGTGLQYCEQPDGDLLMCGAGEFVYKRNCECTGSFCQATNQTLTCQ